MSFTRIRDFTRFWFGTPRGDLRVIQTWRRPGDVLVDLLTMSLFKSCKVLLPIQLHPSRLSDVKEGIHEQLNEYLMK